MGKVLTIMVIIVVLVVIGIATYLLFNTDLLAGLKNQPTFQNDVLVSGIIKTGVTTSPVSISFVSEKTGQASSTTIDKNGHYSITLLGNDTYNATVYYSTLFGVSTNKNCKSILVFNNTITSDNSSRNC